MGRFIGMILLVVMALFFLRNVPELVRYFRIREM